MTLNLKSQPLLPQQENSFRAWLAQPEFALLLDVLNSRLCAKELECAESRFQSDVYPAYELQAKEAARVADELRAMISTLIELRRQPESTPHTTVIAEITPIAL